MWNFPHPNIDELDHPRSDGFVERHHDPSVPIQVGGGAGYSSANITSHTFFNLTNNIGNRSAQLTANRTRYDFNSTNIFGTTHTQNYYDDPYRDSQFLQCTKQFDLRKNFSFSSDDDDSNSDDDDDDDQMPSVFSTSKRRRRRHTDTSTPTMSPFDSLRKSKSIFESNSNTTSGEDEMETEDGNEGSDQKLECRTKRGRRVKYYENLKNFIIQKHNMLLFKNPFIVYKDIDNLLPTLIDGKNVQKARSFVKENVIVTRSTIKHTDDDIYTKLYIDYEFDIIGKMDDAESGAYDKRTTRVVQVKPKSDRKKVFAIKIIPYSEKAMLEARLATCISNTNLVKTYCAWREKDEVYLLMESYLFNLDQVFTHFSKHCLPPENILLSWVKDVASGLSNLHESGILHLDVKPANIYFKKDSTYKMSSQPQSQPQSQSQPPLMPLIAPSTSTQQHQQLQPPPPPPPTSSLLLGSLSPANNVVNSILTDDYPKNGVVLGDFGSAKDFNHDQIKVMRLETVGDDRYIAPEDVASTNADIYSLGASFFEILMDVDMPKKHTDKWNDVRSKSAKSIIVSSRPELAVSYARIIDLVDRMMALTPEDRPSADEVVKEVDILLKKYDTVNSNNIFNNSSIKNGDERKSGGDSICSPIESTTLSIAPPFSSSSPKLSSSSSLSPSSSRSSSPLRSPGFKPSPFMPKRNSKTMPSLKTTTSSSSSSSSLTSLSSSSTSSGASSTSTSTTSGTSSIPITSSISSSALLTSGTRATNASRSLATSSVTSTSPTTRNSISDVLEPSAPTFSRLTLDIDQVSGASTPPFSAGLSSPSSSSSSSSSTGISGASPVTTQLLSSRGPERKKGATQPYSRKPYNLRRNSFSVPLNYQNFTPVTPIPLQQHHHQQQQQQQQQQQSSTEDHLMTTPKGMARVRGSELRGRQDMEVEDNDNDDISGSSSCDKSMDEQGTMDNDDDDEELSLRKLPRNKSDLLLRRPSEESDLKRTRYGYSRSNGAGNGSKSFKCLKPNNDSDISSSSDGVVNNSNKFVSSGPKLTQKKQAYSRTPKKFI